MAVGVLNGFLYAVGESLTTKQQTEKSELQIQLIINSLVSRRHNSIVFILQGGHDAPAVSNPAQSRFSCMERYAP